MKKTISIEHLVHTPGSGIIAYLYWQMIAGTFYNHPLSKTDYAVDSPCLLNKSCNTTRSELYTYILQPQLCISKYILASALGHKVFKTKMEWSKYRTQGTCLYGKALFNNQAFCWQKIIIVNWSKSMIYPNWKAINVSN